MIDAPRDLAGVLQILSCFSGFRVLINIPFREAVKELVCPMKMLQLVLMQVHSRPLVLWEMI